MGKTITEVAELRARLNRLYKEIEYYEDIIQDFSHYENEGGMPSYRNPKEDAIVRKADALQEYTDTQERLLEAMQRLTLCISSLDVRTEVKRATYLFYVQGLSLDSIGQQMHYSKTQTHRLKEEGRDAYESQHRDS